MSLVPSVALDVRRVSPVRGQLEPYDPRIPKGCRYIQCTETPDELKVLLPSSTAAMYGQLLKLENYELSKKPTVSWERLMEIRHLKDRMIRKCQKLAKTTSPTTKKSSRGDSFSFQTFTAPSDFRCKEMEKWFLQQQKRTAPVPRRTITTGFDSAQGVITAGHSHGLPSSSKQPLQRSITNPESSQKHLLHKPLPLIYPTRTDIPLPVLAGMNRITSPPPLPVLLLSQREELGFDDPEPTNNKIAEDALMPYPTLQRRPSCIKRNSLGDIKTVSWADNGEIDKQISQYVSAAREAQAAGKLEEARKLYQDQVDGLEDLHAQVREGLNHLRLETTHLQRIEEAIRKQREALDVGFQEFEQKHALFQVKVHEALTEASDLFMRRSPLPEPLSNTDG